MTSTPDKSRRQFLFAGGVVAVGAAALSACGGSSVVNFSGTIPSTDAPGTAPPTTVDPAALEAERSVLRTATSLEHSLAAFYGTMVAATYLDGDARTWAGRFADHHRANATALEQLTRDAGGEAFTGTNDYLDTELIGPGTESADAAASSDQLIALAAELEATGAATDTIAVSSLVTPELRAGIMAVGATNSRQAYLWRLLGDRENPAAALPDALLSLRDALPATASVDAVADDAEGDDAADGDAESGDDSGD